MPAQISPAGQRFPIPSPSVASISFAAASDHVSGDGGWERAPAGGGEAARVGEKCKDGRELILQATCGDAAFSFSRGARATSPASVIGRISRSSDRCSLITKNQASTLLGDGRPRSQSTGRTIAVRRAAARAATAGQTRVSFLLDLTRFHNLTSRSRDDKRIAVSPSGDRL